MKLRDYQHVAVAHLISNDRAALFLDMGLGKTASALTALEALPALVIAPKRVAEEVWPAEVALWRPDLTVAVAAGRDRRAILADSQADIVTLGRDCLKDLDPRIHSRFKTVILDELSSFKTKTSVRWRCLNRLITKTDPIVWGLTGTPAPNGLMDLWAQVSLLDGGERLGKTLGAYRARYFTPGNRLPSGIITEWRLRPEAEQAIYTKLEDMCLSMSTDGRVSLPEQTIHVVDVRMPAKAAKVYQEMKDTLVSQIADEDVSASNAAVLSAKLSQVSSGAMYADDDPSVVHYLHDAKLDALAEIVEAQQGKPLLVFYRFRHELNRIKERFGDLVHTADTPQVQARWNAKEIPILVAHPASLGHGMNLQYGGSTIVWISLSWSLEEWQQANKRLLRPGQKDPVVIHVISTVGTVDRSILRRLEEKITTQQALLDHLENK